MNFESDGKPEVRDSQAFWHAYIGWLGTSSDDDLYQLEKILTLPTSGEVASMVTRMKAALQDAQLRRQVPESLIESLRAANWPPAQAA